MAAGRSGRTAADNQHVGLGKDGNFAGRLEVGSRGPRALLAPRLTAEELDSLLGAYGVAQVARAGTVLEDFRLEEEASAVFGAFVVRHARFPVPLPLRRARPAAMVRGKHTALRVVVATRHALTKRSKRHTFYA
jgi:hypothetical protein